MTRSGRTYLAITIGVGLGALNTGNNLLFLVLGLLLSAIVVSGVMSELCLRNLRVERLPTSAAFAGEPFAVRWSVFAARTSAFAITLSEAGEGLKGEAALAYVAAGGQRVLRASMTASRRGPIALTGIRVTTTYPLGLFAKTRLLPAPGTLLVFPRRRQWATQPGSTGREHTGTQSRADRVEGSGEVADLRELASGEDARRVHWKKSAAAGKLLRTVREREERHMFMLRVGANLSAPALEHACERTAATAHRLISQGHEVGLETADGRVPPAHGAIQEWRILSALAWLGYDRRIA